MHMAISLSDFLVDRPGIYFLADFTLLDEYSQLVLRSK